MEIPASVEFYTKRSSASSASVMTPESPDMIVSLARVSSVPMLTVLVVASTISVLVSMIRPQPPVARLLVRVLLLVTAPAFQMPLVMVPTAVIDVVTTPAANVVPVRFPAQWVWLSLPTTVTPWGPVTSPASDPEKLVAVVMVMESGTSASAMGAQVSAPEAAMAVAKLVAEQSAGSAAKAVAVLALPDKAPEKVVAESAPVVAL